MRSDRYDEVLPERATVRGPRYDAAGFQIIPPPDGFPARAGDTIEVPCPTCGGGGEGNWLDRDLPFVVCNPCDGSGTLRVRLTEDPWCWCGDPEDHRLCCDGWRHVGEAVTDA